MKNYKLKIHGQDYNVQIDDLDPTSTSAHVSVNGTEYDVEIEGGKPLSTTKPQVSAGAPKATPATAPAAAPVAAAPRPSSSAAGTKINCPLPGTVLSVKVAVGDSVKAGQTLMVLEAMKMENNIDAPAAGTVKEILAKQGASVMEGDTLIVIG